MSTHAAVPRSVLLATVFMTGACVLVIEIMGTRVLAPLFGSGIETWSALIAITLAALALGYWFGGRLADARPRTNVLYGLCGLAGLWTWLTPPLSRWLLPALLPIAGSRGTVLLAAALLFIPNLFLLGALGPFCIRLLTRGADRIGTSSGTVFAVSTLGSLLGALATGFLLIPLFGTSRILAGTAWVLLALAVVGLRGGARLAGLGILGLVAVASLVDGHRAEDGALGRIEVLEHRPSFYGELHVVRTANLVALLSDGIGQNIIQRGSDWQIPYLAFLAQVPEAMGRYREPMQRALVIGLGAGILPARLEAAGLQVTAVEIDPAVAILAQRHFDYRPPDGQPVIMDGRRFLAQSGDHWDFIVLDAFSSEQVPWHLVTRQAFEQVRARLSPGGVLGINFVSLPGNPDVMAVHRTLQTVFPQVRVFLDPHSGRVSNFVFLASLDPVYLGAAVGPGRANDFEAWQAFTGNEVAPGEGPLILTDDHNPIDELRRNVHEAWRASMREWLRADGLSLLMD